MSQLPVSVSPAVIQLFFVTIIGLIGLVNALFFFILRRIKKNFDEECTRGRGDHDRIIVLESKFENLEKRD